MELNAGQKRTDLLQETHFRCFWKRTLKTRGCAAELRRAASGAWWAAVVAAVVAVPSKFTGHVHANVSACCHGVPISKGAAPSVLAVR